MRTLIAILIVGLLLIAAALLTFIIGPLAEISIVEMPVVTPASVSLEVVGSAEGITPLWLVRLNDLRAHAGLPPVVEDSARSTMAAQHVQYMLWNVLEEGFWHGETPGRPGYSAGGQQAAEQSNLAWVENMLLSPAEAVTIWQESPEHRERMLAPGLQQVGFALACNPRHCAAALYVGQ